ncbi:MAG: hypothetical protein SVV03_03465 [Candidatus Nanohaloarchaea archaeon]|nr:hypothetical protein [Candidatus Nanohaloarchaea archaeon]
MKITESSFDYMPFNSRGLEAGAGDKAGTHIEPKDVRVNIRITAEYLIK